MINEIRELKLNFDKHKRNFLRANPKYVPFLQKEFGKLDNKELNYLIDNKKTYCVECGANTKFINHENGYKLYCSICAQVVGNRKIADSIKNRVNKCKCGELLTGGKKICDSCKEEKESIKYKCIVCDKPLSKETTSKNITSIYVCEEHELEYLLKSKNLKKSCAVNFHKHKFCKECGVSFYDKENKNDSCKLHRKKCKVCGKFFTKQGITCSLECTNIQTERTSLKRYGVPHNLLVRGSKKSHYEFWLNKGFTVEESLFKSYSFQSKVNSKFSKLSDVYGFFKDNLYIIKEYRRDIVISTLNIEGNLLKIYDIYIKSNNVIEGSKTCLLYKNIFGTNITVIDSNNRLIKLRSKLEFFFFLLLEANKIKFYTNKRYKNSKMYYDFYLPKHESYIEIAGLAGIEDYDAKMKYKNEKFGSIILKDKREMLEYIKTIKALDGSK